MLQFTISSIAGVVRPYQVLKSGSHSGDPEGCTVNEIPLKVGDWVAVSGEIHQESAIKVFRQYGREFEGKEPNHFSFMLSSWYEAASLEPGTPIHWAEAFHWDGLSLTAMGRPSHEYRPVAAIEV